MRKFTLVTIFLFITLTSHSQDQVPGRSVSPRMNFGLGAGLDYGGFGARITYLVSENFELFGAGGYNLLGLGVNAGIDFRAAPRSVICPYAGVMYGYNAVIKISGADEYNKTYYGPTWNFGVEIWSGRQPNFLNLELLLPVRSDQFKNDLKYLKNNPFIVFKNEVYPVAIAIGYHFMF